jgi:diacylglycerol kinase family enzyme
VNLAAGSVDPDAAAALRSLLEDFCLHSRVVAPEPAEIADAVKAAIAAAPELLVVLAGDGTASLAADLCGPDGPLLIPLPGGTMNLLSRALYGGKTWPEALIAALRSGTMSTVAGGEVNGQRFYCAAIVGSPALWGPAREAARSGKLRKAWRRALLAFRRAFLSRLRFQMTGGAERHSMALALVCPLMSPSFDRDDALEAIGLDLRDAAQVFRLGLHGIFGDWRADEAVSTEAAVTGTAWAKRAIPALLDGELHRFPRSVNIRFVPGAFRTLVPAAPQEADGTASKTKTY